jgi:hypothetical protein
VNHLSAHGKEATVIVAGSLEIPILLALLDGGEKVLAPVLDPSDRAPQQKTRRGERRLFWIHHEFGPEASADIGSHDAQLILVQAQHCHEKGARLVSKLRR